MGRHYSPVMIKESDRALLQEAAQGGDDIDPRVSKRAKMVLACAEGRPIHKIAEELHERSNTIILWRDRYEAEGITGLYDKKKSGRTRKYGDALKNLILQTLEDAPPSGQPTWDGPSLAEALHVPVHAVWAILREEGIELARKHTWTIPVESPFQAISITIAGLFLSMDMNALVLIAGEDAPRLPTRGTLMIPGREMHAELAALQDAHEMVTLPEAMDFWLDGAHDDTDSRINHGLAFFLDKAFVDRDKAQWIVLADRPVSKALDWNWRVKHANVCLQVLDPGDWPRVASAWCRMMLPEKDQDSRNTFTNALVRYVENPGPKPALMWYRS